MNETEAFTLVVLRWKKEQMSLFEPEEYFYHIVATKMEVDAEVVIKIHEESVPDSCRVVWQYNERARLENYLKELKKFNHYLRMMDWMEAIAALSY